MTKKELRKALAPLTQAEGERDAQLAFERLKTLPLFLNAKVIASYMPMEDEVQLQPINEWILEAGKQLVLPRVLSKTQMAFYQVGDLHNLECGVFGIQEPPRHRLVQQDEIDLILVPLMALSVNGVRLGRGGGYYDRYLASYQGETIAILNKKRLFQTLPKEKHDVMVNYYIVEGKLSQCGGNKL